MKKQTTKKQHYIPQFYLKRFTDKNGFLHIYDLEQKKYFPSIPRNFGFEDYLYETELSKPNRFGERFLLTNNIEDTFAKYEAEFAMLLKKLDKICTPLQNPHALILHSNEKVLLYHFIANIFVRHPYTMKELKIGEVPDDFFEDDAKELFNTFLEQFGICNADEIVEASSKKAMLTNELDNNYIKEFAEKLSRLNFFFIYTKKQPFITSSFPVIIGDDYSTVGDNRMSIFMALSPNLAVIFGNYKNSKHKNNRLGFADSEVVDFFNKQHIQMSINWKKYIISSSKENLSRYFDMKEVK